MDHESSDTRPVDYKTLFLGACTLVLALGGALVGYWNSTSNGELASLRASNTEQWRQIREYHNSLLEIRAKYEWLRDQTGDQEGRLRDHEKRLNKLER